jgi:hypothetical protein
MTQPRDADRRLAAAVWYARRGRRDALNYLYCRFADEVADSILPIGDERDAEEITRSLFAALPETIAEYDAALHGPFRVWLLASALKVALDRPRSV